MCLAKSPLICQNFVGPKAEKLRHPPLPHLFINNISLVLKTFLLKNKEKTKTQCTVYPKIKGQLSVEESLIYLEGGGTLGERDRGRLISADREQWLDDITCSGTDNVELWKSLPFGR